MRWTGAALSAGTALTNANVQTAGNGDVTGITVTSSNSPSMIMASDSGVTFTGATPAQGYLVLPRTATKFSVSQFIYTANESSATISVLQLRSTSANAGNFTQFSNGKVGIQDASQSGVGTSSTIAIVNGHEYLVDIVNVVGTTTSNGRCFWRIRDLTDPTWNTTGEYFFDTGYTVNMGANVDVIAHRMGRVSTTSQSLGFKIRQLGWNSLSSVDTSLTASVAKSHFMAAPIQATNGSQTAVTITTSGVGTAIRTGSSQTSVAITTESSGGRHASGSSQASVEITTQGTGSKNVVSGTQVSVPITVQSGAARTSSGSSQTSIGVTSQTAGRKVSTGSGQPSVTITTQAAGFKRGVAGTQTNVTITSQGGTGHKVGRSGSQTTVTITGQGGGHRLEAGSGGTTTSVGITALSGGRKNVVRASQLSVPITVQSSGRKHAFGGGIPLVAISVATGLGWKIIATGTQVAVPIGVETGGVGNNEGGSQTPVDIVTGTSGYKVTVSGTQSIVPISSLPGSGIKNFTGGTSTNVVIGTSAGPGIKLGTGGSQSTVVITTEGAGYKPPTIAVPTVPIKLTSGPTRVTRAVTMRTRRSITIT